MFLFGSQLGESGFYDFGGPRIGVCEQMPIYPQSDGRGSVTKATAVSLDSDDATGLKAMLPAATNQTLFITLPPFIYCECPLSQKNTHSVWICEVAIALTPRFFEAIGVDKWLLQRIDPLNRLPT
jgi:hypothetical protein